MTLAPSCATLSDVARPIPEPPPVTSTTFPCSSSAINLSPFRAINFASHPERVAREGSLFLVPASDTARFFAAQTSLRMTKGAFPTQQVAVVILRESATEESRFCSSTSDALPRVLTRDPAAVDRHRMARHERRRVRQQPRHAFADLFGLAHSANRLARHEVLLVHPAAVDHA